MQWNTPYQKALVALSLVAALLAPAKGTQACTTFQMVHGDQIVMGNSYDWALGVALVTINTRGNDKSGLVMPGQSGIQWVSQYGSVTVNQYGRENPTAGMNEMGLVVEQMALGESEYPAENDTPIIGELQWMQYMLDTCQSVEEVIAAAPAVRVSPAYMSVHYMACDTTGACAMFEYLGGELVVTSGQDVVVNTMTNHPYDESVEYLADHQGFGGDTPIPDGLGSLERFVRASSLAATPSQEQLPDAAFTILDSVFTEEWSQWNLVYVPEQGRLYFRTLGSSRIKYVDLSSFELDCTSPYMVLDIDADQEGDVSASFEPYTQAHNLALLEQSMVDVREQLGEFVFGLLVDYPTTIDCTMGTEDGGPDGDGDADADADGDADASTDGDADADVDGPGDADTEGDDAADAATDGDTAGDSDDGCKCAATPRRGGAGAALLMVALGLVTAAARRRRSSK